METKCFFGNPDVQASAQIISQERNGDTVTTRFKLGRLIITGSHSRPSDRAIQNFRDSLDTALAARVEAEATTRKSNLTPVVA